MPDASPSVCYYRSLVGRWSGRFELLVTDRSALGRQSLFARLVGTAVRFGGRARIATTLAAKAPDRFHHTTLVSRFGLPLLRSSETITLAADGTSFVIEGWQCFLWRREPYRATGTITADGQGAHYPITWLGAPLDQTTRIEGRCLRLCQRTAWSAGEVLLERQP